MALRVWAVRVCAGHRVIDDCENTSQLLLVMLDAQHRVTPSAVHQSRQLGCTVESFTSADLLAYWKANGIAADRCWYSCAELDDDWQVRGRAGHWASAALELLTAFARPRRCTGSPSRADDSLLRLLRP